MDSGTLVPPVIYGLYGVEWCHVGPFVRRFVTARIFVRRDKSRAIHNSLPPFLSLSRGDPRPRVIFLLPFCVSCDVAGVEMFVMASGSA